VWLVLAEEGDAAARWAADRLRRRGLAPLDLLTPRDLSTGTRSEHRLRAGAATLALTLADGRTIDSEGLRGVLNRVSTVPRQRLAAARPADADYAREEWSALVLSWLACLPAVINPPHPLGLSGHWRHDAEWVMLAARAGLPVAPYTWSSHTAALPLQPRPGDHPVVVLDGRTFSTVDLDAETAGACGRLGTLAGLRLLGCWLRPRPTGRPALAAVTLLPDLRIGGDPLLAALEAALTAAPDDAAQARP
jgi:hypothetical protein